MVCPSRCTVRSCSRHPLAPLFLPLTPRSGRPQALNSILVQHIAALLPSMRHSMEAQLNARVNEVAKYGESPAGASTAAHGAMLLRLVSEFADCFGQMVNGNYAALPTNTIAGGARIRYIFRVGRRSARDRHRTAHCTLHRWIVFF